MTKIKNKIKESFSKGFWMGTGFAAAFLTTSLLAIAVTLPKTWAAGDVLTAADINANFAALKTAIEGQTQAVSMSYIYLGVNTTNYLGIQATTTNSTESYTQSLFPKTVTVKNFRVKIIDSNLTAANTITLTVTKNGIATPLVITIPNNITAPIGTVITAPAGTSASYTSSDLFSIKIANPSTAGVYVMMDFELE